MTREELSQIYWINKEIHMWQRELDRLECQSLVKGQEITNMPFSTDITDKVGNLAVKKADIRIIIEGKLAEIQIQRARIMDYIDSIDDSYIRQIVFLRNVSCMKWEQIAMELGGSSEAIKKAYQRYFPNPKSCPTCPEAM